ncbi:MAG TPA: hypothetical protein VKX41_16955 [Alloacidobacterium sp.]|nr:hypothetical protein [Alloacidobacterium sp.]
MKLTMRLLAAVMLAIPALVHAQHEGMPGMGHSAPVGSSDESARTFLMMATDKQRTAFAECMDATQRVSAAIEQMKRTGSPWSRGRASYDPQDLRKLTEQQEKFESALSAMTAAHQAFWGELNEAQKNGLDRQLRKLNHLEADLNSSSLLMSQILMDAKPGPGSPKLRWDVNAITKDLGEWRSEHTKIAKTMSIPL